MDRSECVDGISHCLPACVREVRPRESFRSWECEASSHRFSTKGPVPQKATRGRARTLKVPPLRDETQRTKFAQAAKIFIDSSTDLTDGESSGLSVLSVLSVVSVFCLFMVSCFLVRLRLFRKAAGSKTGAQIREEYRRVRRAADYGRRR